jgi:hypothetical protein
MRPAAPDLTGGRGRMEKGSRMIGSGEKRRFWDGGVDTRRTK